jgi:hypothetical protein
MGRLTKEKQMSANLYRVTSSKNCVCHVLATSMEDALCRWRARHGYKEGTEPDGVAYVPGDEVIGEMAYFGEMDEAAEPTTPDKPHEEATVWIWRVGSSLFVSETQPTIAEGPGSYEPGSVIIPDQTSCFEMTRSVGMFSSMAENVPTHIQASVLHRFVSHAAEESTEFKELMKRLTNS